MTPGPDSLIVVSRSIRFGVSAGVIAGAGVVVGTFVHVLLAMLGVAALIAESAMAFMLLKILGAVYLIYLGVRAFRQSDLSAENLAENSKATPDPQSVHGVWRQSFLQGFLSNVSNPKVALFFLAFVPQFIPPESASVSGDFFVLGCLFNLSSMGWSICLAVLSARTARSEVFNRTVKVWLNRIVGLLFFGFGARLIFQLR